MSFHCLLAYIISDIIILILLYAIWFFCLLELPSRYSLYLWFQQIKNMIFLDVFLEGVLILFGASLSLLDL